MVLKDHVGYKTKTNYLELFRKTSPTPEFHSQSQVTKSQPPCDQKYRQHGQEPFSSK